MERKSLKKNTKLSFWEEMAPSSNEALRIILRFRETTHLPLP